MSSSDKMLAVLRLFTVEAPVWTVELASQEIGASISTTYRYFRSLQSAGLLAGAGNGSYILGPATIELDWLVRRTDPLLLVSQPAMEILSQAARSPTVLLLCRLYRDRVMCVGQEVAGNPSFASSYERGRPMPLYRGAASKVILANMPERKVKSLYLRDAAEMAESGLGETWPEVRLSLQKIRGDEISVTRSEIDAGVIGIAASIAAGDAMPVGSICTVVSAREVGAEEVESLSRLLRSAAIQISRELLVHAAS